MKVRFWTIYYKSKLGDNFAAFCRICFLAVVKVFVPDNPQPLETPSGKMETMASIKTNRGPVPHSHT